MKEKNSKLDREDLAKLELEKNRAEEDKEAAITALEARSIDLVKEKNERAKLEAKIDQLASQMLIGGHQIEDTP